MNKVNKVRFRNFSKNVKFQFLWYIFTQSVIQYIIFTMLDKLKPQNCPETMWNRERASLSTGTPNRGL